MTDLNNLPFGLSKNHSVNKIRDWYITSFIEVTEMKEPNSVEDIKLFNETIENIYNRHASTLMTMTKGIYELKQDNKITDTEAPQIQNFLNKFYRNRTELRIIIEHYLALTKGNSNSNNLTNSGIINFQCPPPQYQLIN